MASRYRSLSRSCLSLLKSAVNKPTLKPNPMPSSQLLSRSVLTSPRSVPQLGALQSLLPLHSAVSSARLTSCLGIDSRSSRSLSQGVSDNCQNMKKTLAYGLVLGFLYIAVVAGVFYSLPYAVQIFKRGF